MLCDFLISLVASYIAVLTSAAGLIDGTAGIVFSVIEVIIVSLLFFTREGKAFTRRVIGSFIAYPLLALLTSESGLYEQAFGLFNPQYYNEYGIGFDYSFGFLFVWLPFAGVMLALSALIGRLFCRISENKRGQEDEEAEGLISLVTEEREY
ncbi:MAG: hypothetical protein IJZ51_11860 [Ruminiclostridium sp.]|nr:hypothetical protein [Ruminiclostridium sp.]